MAFDEFVRPLLRGPAPSAAFGAFTGAEPPDAFTAFVNPTRVPTAFAEFQGSPTGPAVSAAFTTLTAADYTPPADGVTETALTATIKDANDAPLEGVAVTAVIVPTVVVSASESLVSAAATTPVDTPVDVTIVVRDAAGNPIEGIPAELVVLSASGSNNTVVQPTGFSDANGELFGASYTATTTGPRTLTVTVGGLALADTPSVNVGGVPTVHFFTEWTRTSTGLTDAEMLDGTKWDGVQGDNVGPAAIIEESGAVLTGRGDPFRCNNAGTNSRQIRKDAMVPASTTHFGRVYFVPNRTTGRQNHAVSIGGLSGNPINFGLGGIGTPSGEQVLCGSMREEDGTILLPPFARWSPGNVVNANAYDFLTNGQPYLLEWGIEYLTPTTFRPRIWLSEVNSAGAITNADVYTAADFYQGDYPGSGTANLEDTVTVAGLGGTAELARRYLFGNDGPGSGASTDSGYIDYYSFAISLDGRLRDMAVV